jgi:predicted NBD/HSP70 family sugar kinase
VNRLIRSSIVYEGAEAPSSGGRRPTYLQVNAEKAYVIGISIGVQQSFYGISDFNGRILNRRTQKTELDAALFLTRIAKDIASDLKEKFRRPRLAGVGVSIPGLVDRLDGHLVRSPNLGWSDVPIRSILERELEIPVFVENDANAAALSELWYGPIDLWAAHCIVFVLVVEGIGIGLILNGELYVGSRIGLGGFGHVPMDPQGPLCSCGNVGCWEALASDRATLSRFAQLSTDGNHAGSVRELIGLATSGDRRACEALQVTGRSLGRGIRGLAHGLSPELIVIGGEITGAWPMIEGIVNSEMQGEYLLAGISRPGVRPASVDQPAFFGAFPVGLRSVLQKRKRARGVF